MLMQYLAMGKNTWSAQLSVIWCLLWESSSTGCLKRKLFKRHHLIKLKLRHTLYNSEFSRFFLGYKNSSDIFWVNDGWHLQENAGVNQKDFQTEDEFLHILIDQHFYCRTKAILSFLSDSCHEYLSQKTIDIFL